MIIQTMVVYLFTEKPQCGLNEEWAKMEGCEETCNDALGLDAEDDACAMTALHGCACKEGYVRNAQGACVDIPGCHPMPTDCKIKDPADCINGKCSLPVRNFCFSLLSDISLNGV